MYFTQINYNHVFHFNFIFRLHTLDTLWQTTSFYPCLIHVCNGWERNIGRSCTRFSIKPCFAVQCAEWMVHGFRNDQLIGKSTKCIACIWPNFSTFKYSSNLYVQQNVGKKGIIKWNPKLIFVITFLLSNYKHSHINIVQLCAMVPKWIDSYKHPKLNAYKHVCIWHG